MKRLLFCAFIFMLLFPLGGAAQQLSWYNLGVYAGVEYNKLHWDNDDGSNPYTGTRDNFNIRPHFQLTYEIALNHYFQPLLFAGYSKMGYQESIVIDGILADEARQHLRMNTLSVGVIGLFDTSLFKIGPIFSWYTILDGEYEYQIKEELDQWSTIHTDESYDRFLADHSYEIGFSIKKFLGPNFVFSFEGFYSIEDIFIHESKLPFDNLRDYEWFPQHYRFTIGYAL